MSYLVVSGTCVQRIKVHGHSTSEEAEKLKLKCEEWIKTYKCAIANAEDRIIRCEEVLGGRGESSIIRYY